MDSITLSKSGIVLKREAETYYAVKLAKNIGLRIWFAGSTGKWLAVIEFSGSPFFAEYATSLELALDAMDAEIMRIRKALGET